MLRKDWIKALAWNFWMAQRFGSSSSPPRRVVLCKPFFDHQFDAVPEFRCIPLHFPARWSALWDFAQLAGSLIGLATNGRLSDWILPERPKRNNCIGKSKDEITYSHPLRLHNAPRKHPHCIWIWASNGIGGQANSFPFLLHLLRA
jgi:hypothetical protein